MISISLVLLSYTVAVPDRVLDRWLDLTRQAESSGRRYAIGDAGRSRGPYQIQKAAWRQFGGRGPWRVNAHDEAESRRVARRYLVAAVAECRRRGWTVSYRNVRHLYRYGLNTSVSP